MRTAASVAARHADDVMRPMRTAAAAGRADDVMRAPSRATAAVGRTDNVIRAPSRAELVIKQLKDDLKLSALEHDVWQLKRVR